MQKYIVGIFAALVAAAILALGWMYHRASSDCADAKAALAATKNALAAATAANEANQAAIARLDASTENTDKILAGWNADRTTLAGVRNTTRTAIKEAMRNETFKAWADTRLPDDVGRLLGAAIGNNANGNGSPGAAASAPGRLPGNDNPNRHQRRPAGAGQNAED